MTGQHYTEQEKAKVRAMVQYGLSKNKAAQILHIAPATIWRWNIPSTFKNKTYSREIKQEAIQLYKVGLSRLKISIKLGVGMRALNRWLGKSKDGREFKVYPKEIRLKARQLARNGVPKFEIPNLLHVSHPTIIRWTSDIKENKDRVSGTYFKLLVELINNGFIIMKREDIWRYRILKRYANVRAVVFGRRLIILVPDKKRVAERLLINVSKTEGLSKRKLNNIKSLFNMDRRGTNGFNY